MAIPEHVVRGRIHGHGRSCSFRFRFCFRASLRSTRQAADGAPFSSAKFSQLFVSRINYARYDVAKNYGAPAEIMLSREVEVIGGGRSSGSFVVLVFGDSDSEERLQVFPCGASEHA
jgi:hypothetical protein